MKSFYQLLESLNFQNPEIHSTWQMIDAEISGIQSYLEAGHDVKIVLDKLREKVKYRLMDLEFNSR